MIFCRCNYHTSIHHIRYMHLEYQNRLQFQQKLEGLEAVSQKLFAPVAAALQWAAPSTPARAALTHTLTLVAAPIFGSAGRGKLRSWRGLGTP